MKKVLFLLMILSFPLMAKFIDNDLDGVDDRRDKCLNTPFNALVDKDGCPVKILNIHYEKKLKYDFYTEVSKIKDDNTNELSQLFYFSTSKNRYYFTISTSLNDLSGERYISNVTMKIKKYFNPFYNIRISSGIGVKIPTKDLPNNKIDIPLYLSMTYSLGNKSFFIGSSYTFINDKSQYYNYKNSKFFYTGFSYSRKNILTSISYMVDKNRYDETSKSLGFTIYFLPNKSSYYFSLGYTKGLDSYAIDSIYSFGVGKTF